MIELLKRKKITIFKNLTKKLPLTVSDRKEERSQLKVIYINKYNIYNI